MTAIEIVTITDRRSGSRARIAPSLGFNCFSFEAATTAGPLELLWSAPDFVDGKAKPSGSGIPLMFPFAGRIRGTSFRFEGKTYPLTAGDALGNAIHGFVINRPWRVAQQAEHRASGQFQASVDDRTVLEHWPADFRITADYYFADGALVSEFLIENPDSKPLPFGFGTHGYYRVPLGGASADDCLVRVPVKTHWELAGLLPTGKRTSPPLVGELSRGMRFADTRLDDVFSDLACENHRCTTSIHDPVGRRTLEVTFDDLFAACVVYNPPHRQAVCIEPYTTVPDPFTLLEQGIDPHLQVLAPGKTFRARVETRLVSPKG